MADASATVGSGAVPKPGASDLTLSVNRGAIAGWEQISVTLRAEGFPNSFDVTLSTRDPVTSANVIVKPGDECTVQLGSDTVITGYVDSLDNGGSANGHTLRVTGRGKCQDLVDCSAEWDSGQITGASALEVAKKFASKYNITVRQLNGADPGPAIDQFNLNYGETAAEIIQRVAHNAGLLAYEDSKGILVLGRAGTGMAASGVVYGGNVESWNVRLSMNERFSDIVCLTQAINEMMEFGGTDALVFGHEKDPNVPRHRLMYMPMESAGGNQGTAQDFTKRKAKWEAARRAGRATAASATIDSWRDSAGKLWAPNTLVPVSLPGLPPQLSPLAISEVTFRRDESGTHADLALLPPTAFAPEPVSIITLNTSDLSKPPAP